MGHKRARRVNWVLGGGISVRFGIVKRMGVLWGGDEGNHVQDCGCTRVGSASKKK